MRVAIIEKRKRKRIWRCGNFGWDWGFHVDLAVGLTSSKYFVGESRYTYTYTRDGIDQYQNFILNVLSDGFHVCFDVTLMKGHLPVDNFCVILYPREDDFKFSRPATAEADQHVIFTLKIVEPSIFLYIKGIEHQPPRKLMSRK